MALNKLRLDGGALCEGHDSHQDYGIMEQIMMLNYSLGLRQRIEGHCCKRLQEILSIYQSIWTLIYMIRFGIGISLVEKRERLCLEYGLGFNTDLAHACDTGY